MTGNDDHPGFGSQPEALHLAQDRRLELFLDEMVASSPSLPHDFTARVKQVTLPFAQIPERGIYSASAFVR